MKWYRVVASPEAVTLSSGIIEWGPTCSYSAGEWPFWLTQPAVTMAYLGISALHLQACSTSLLSALSNGVLGAHTSKEETAGHT